MNGVTVAPVRPPASEGDLAGLAAVLCDAVDSGASVSFMPPFSAHDARAFWTQVARKAAAEPRCVLLAARDTETGRILGTVQLQPAWAPNQPHRADVAKLLVHRDARGRGVGAALMTALEDHARAAGFSLLTLDTVRASAAERLYLRLGWSRVGEIPRFALNPDGSYCDTVLFYKTLADAAPARGLKS